jgi:hypothetical protein
MQTFRYTENDTTCGGLFFHQEYIHVEALQDERMQWEDLSRAAQLNVACNAGAKVMLRS